MSLRRILPDSRWTSYATHQVNVGSILRRGRSFTDGIRDCSQITPAVRVDVVTSNNQVLTGHVDSTTEEVDTALRRAMCMTVRTVRWVSQGTDYVGNHVDLTELFLGVVAGVGVNIGAE
ncbi:hypothetical protein D3C80_1770400 [compost metagenome]